MRPGAAAPTPSSMIEEPEPTQETSDEQAAGEEWGPLAEVV